MLEGRCAAAPELCQGCSSPYAFETALRLLEIEEEIVGARMTRSTSQGVSNSDKHPSLPGGYTSAYVHRAIDFEQLAVRVYW